ncbi:MAG: hypothetical protein ICV70_05415 [Jiangellaceae bacterium]|nr:hypothetical protein [Jiangellaceae bacterium]
MIGLLATVLIVLALGYAAAAIVLTALGKAPREYYVITSAALTVLVLVQVLIAVVLLLTGQRPDELGTFVGYLIVALILLPVGTVWALAERSRWGTAVLAVACLALAVVVVRLQDLWSTAGG